MTIIFCLQPGLGNITAGCLPCECDVDGSTSSLCDGVSGQCPCLPGVGGAHCSACLSLHYGFSPSGCKRKQNVRFYTKLRHITSSNISPTYANIRQSA